MGSNGIDTAVEMCGKVKSSTPKNQQRSATSHELWRTTAPSVQEDVRHLPRWVHTGAVFELKRKSD
jgi:hypothetical protein